MKKIISLFTLLLLSFPVMIYSQNPAKGFNKISKNELDDAFQIFKEIIAKDSTDICANYGLAWIYDNRNNLFEAIKYAKNGLNERDKLLKGNSSDIRELAKVDETIQKFSNISINKLFSSIDLKLFTKISNDNNIDTIEKFISICRYSEHYSSAIVKRENYYHEDAIEDNSIESYQNFMNKFPNSRYIPSMKEKIYQFAFANAISKNTPDAFEDFIVKYPDSKQQGKAIYKRDSLNFYSFKISKDTNEINAFLAEYPESKFYNDARNLKMEISFTSLSSIEKLNDYINKDPNAGNINLAYEKRDSLLFEVAKGINTWVAYYVYISNFPCSKQVSKAIELSQSIGNNVKKCKVYKYPYKFGTLSEDGELIYEVSYDKNGNIINECNYKKAFSGDESHISKKTVYKYDNNNMLTNIEVYDGYIGFNNFSKETTFKYDNSKRLIEKNTVVSYNNYDNKKYIYTYFDNDSINSDSIKTISEYKEDGVLQQRTFNKYNFDENEVIAPRALGNGYGLSGTIERYKKIGDKSNYFVWKKEIEQSTPNNIQSTEINRFEYLYSKRIKRNISCSTESNGSYIYNNIYSNDILIRKDIPPTFYNRNEIGLKKEGLIYNYDAQNLIISFDNYDNGWISSELVYKSFNNHNEFNNSYNNIALIKDSYDLNKAALDELDNNQKIVRDYLLKYVYEKTSGSSSINNSSDNNDLLSKLIGKKWCTFFGNGLNVYILKFNQNNTLDCYYGSANNPEYKAAASFKINNNDITICIDNDCRIFNLYESSYPKDPNGYLVYPVLIAKDAGAITTKGAIGGMTYEICH